MNLREALELAYSMLSTEGGYCPQCGDGSGAYYDINSDIHQCQWCFHANEIKAVLKMTPSGWPAATLKDHDRVALQNSLRDVAVKYHATQQLRSRIGTVLEQYIKGRD